MHGAKNYGIFRHHKRSLIKTRPRNGTSFNRFASSEPYCLQIGQAARPFEKNKAKAKSDTGKNDVISYFTYRRNHSKTTDSSHFWHTCDITDIIKHANYRSMEGFSDNLKIACFRTRAKSSITLCSALSRSHVKAVGGVGGCDMVKLEAYRLRCCKTTRCKH